MTPTISSMPENHFVDRMGWLRAAVLGANDGILSTGSLILGVASASGSHGNVLVAGPSGLVAGSMSMAAGEHVSVSSQADIEKADLDRERLELSQDEAGESRELTRIYIERGLDEDLAREVARQLMAKNALEAHARDELGISEALSARPVQATLTSAVSFAAGAALPLGTATLVPAALTTAAVAVASLLSLVVLGAVGAHVGGAGMAKAAVRVTFWGALAMAVTAGIGALFGTSVG